MKTFYDNFIVLCEQNNVKPSKVAQDIGLDKSNATYWKHGSLPKIGTIQAIAQYFGVTVDYLTGLNELQQEIQEFVNTPHEWVTRSPAPVSDNDASDEALKLALSDLEGLSPRDKEDIKQFIEFIKQRNAAKERPQSPAGQSSKQTTASTAKPAPQATQTATEGKEADKP